MNKRRKSESDHSLSKNYFKNTNYLTFNNAKDIDFHLLRKHLKNNDEEEEEEKENELCKKCESIPIISLPSERPDSITFIRPRGLKAVNVNNSIKHTTTIPIYQLNYENSHRRLCHTHGATTRNFIGKSQLKRCLRFLFPLKLLFGGKSRGKKSQKRKKCLFFLYIFC